MDRFVKKPVEVEAMQFLGNNARECLRWICGHPDLEMGDPDWEDEAPYLIIETLSGDHCCSVGDWIIKGPKGDGHELYPCDREVFERTYDAMQSRMEAVS